MASALALAQPRAANNMMAVVWVDPATHQAGGTLFLSLSELRVASTAAAVETLLAHKLAAQAPLSSIQRGAGSLKLFGQPLKGAESLGSYLPLLRTSVPRFVFSLRLLPLHVRAPAGQTVLVHVDASKTIAHVKTEIQVALGIPASEQRLLHGGVPLLDAHPIRLAPHATLTLALRLRGGGGGDARAMHGLVFADLANEALLRQLPLAPGPTWLHVCRGLNVEGICENDACEAYGDEVVACHEFNAFNLTAHRACCPSCHTKFVPRTCGFYKCLWRFEGVRHGSGVHLSSEWREASGDLYHLFEASESNLALWLTLLVSVRPCDSHECPVCFEPLATADGEARVTQLKCKHTVHATCMGEWTLICTLQGQPGATCPICRAQIRN
ncbi:Aste57867_24223 [Aphanomyces stellatus]|uniref:Aste57867_24223 protein n=1 Tax=Aphanomyces stellatus TaxID=120398 RepID=A0A485LRM1_9STRA|nr:hypothetical protein As57867_024148 [Aphanomyces stellatus]VFU00864.1 Aste57867_24223 [Aphanomyces stellatus]